MVKSRIPTFRDFPQDKDHAGWPLYSYVMGGINLLDKSKALNEIQSLQLFDAPFDIQESNVEEILQKRYNELQQWFKEEEKDTYTYN